MLGIDRRTINIAWTLFLFALLLVVVHEIGRTLLIFALALTFAFLLAPVVNALERTFHARIPRVVSLAVVYVILTAAIAVTMIPLGTRLSQEAGALASRDDMVQIIDNKRGMGAFCRMEIGLDTDVEIHEAGHEPYAVASRHFGRLLDFG